MLIRELLSEASTPRRAWEGKLEKIDKLLAWMYDKDILTATDKKKKDSVFRQYYRYYNDGDMPAALKKRGISKWSGRESIEKALEEYLEEFIKEMLAKYLPKADRTEFRYDTLIKTLTSVSNVIQDNDVYGLLNYWIKKVKIKDDSGKLAELLENLETLYKTLKKKADAADPKSSNTTITYRRDQMKKSSLWTDSMERDYIEIEDLMGKVGSFVTDAISAVKKLKNLHELEK